MSWTSIWLRSNETFLNFFQASTSKFGQSSWTGRKSNYRYGTRRDRRGSGPSPPPTTGAPWASCWCTTSRTRRASTTSRTGSETSRSTHRPTWRRWSSATSATWTTGARSVVLMWRKRSRFIKALSPKWPMQCLLSVYSNRFARACSALHFHGRVLFIARNGSKLTAAAPPDIRNAQWSHFRCPKSEAKNSRSSTESSSWRHPRRRP